jgi:putative ABC transport system permease protein
MPDEDMTETYTEMVTQQAKMQYAAGVKAQMAGMPAAQLEMALAAGMATYTDAQFATYYDEVLEFAETTYDENLIELGYVTLDDPASINIYASSFENKDIIEEIIADYNADKEELQQITYTDYVGLMMSSITTIINAITYVLIAFVAISLVVSSIMIGVITLISVQERTKEIGILRAIGASKRNVSSMFNAETVIIGFTSGLLGVGITYALCIPINLILHHLTDIQNLNAILPPEAAILLVAISVVLTLFAGIIPSRSAAKKDPVVALRSE